MLRIKRTYKANLIAICIILATKGATAQLTDGATAPDFTFSDLNGVSHNLYSYLNAGKYVALDISATWCNPCWNYHSSGVMDSMYTKHDAPGDQTWKVLFIEADGNTTVADLNGTGTNTVGNWVSGALFPIINATGVPLNDFKTAYDINSYPRLYLICPNKKIISDTINIYPRASVAVWEYAANNLCGPAGIDDIKDSNPLTIFPNPCNRQTTLFFSLNKSSRFELNVSNIIGQQVLTKEYGWLQAGDQSLSVDVDALMPGLYFFMLRNSEGICVTKKVTVY